MLCCCCEWTKKSCAAPTSLSLPKNSVASQTFFGSYNNCAKLANDVAEMQDSLSSLLTRNDEVMSRYSTYS